MVVMGVGGRFPPLPPLTGHPLRGPRTALHCRPAMQAQRNALRIPCFAPLGGGRCKRRGSERRGVRREREGIRKEGIHWQHALLDEILAGSVNHGRGAAGVDLVA